MAQLQQAVLFSGPVDKEAYGDHVIEVKFKQPVQISSVSITTSMHAAAKEKTMFRGGWARDLFSASAARFVALLPTVTVPAHDVPATEAFATDHLVLHGKFCSVLVTVSGYVLATAAEQVKAAAENQLEIELPAANQALQLPASPTATTNQLQDQGKQLFVQLQLPLAPLLPLAKLPTVFVQALVGGVQYWRQVRLSHSRIEFNPPNGRLEQLTALADAVLAAMRGKPGVLQALASSSTAAEEAAAGSNWAAVEDDALDMAASWCLMLASCRTHTPFDMEVGVAGLAASILLASCSATAAQYLALKDARQELAGAAAVRGVICTPNAPPLISRYGLGLLELLLSSCPAISCATLLGPYTPELVTKQQPQDSMVKPDHNSNSLLQLNGEMDRLQQLGSHIRVKAEPHSTGSQHEGLPRSWDAGAGSGAGLKGSRRSGARTSISGLDAAAGGDTQQSQHAGMAPPAPPPPAGAPAGAAADTVNDGPPVSDEDDGDGLYDELGSDGQQQGSDAAAVYDDVNQHEGAEQHDTELNQAGCGEGDGYDDDCEPQQSEETLQLDADEDMYEAEEFFIHDDEVQANGTQGHEGTDQEQHPTGRAAVAGAADDMGNMENTAKEGYTGLCNGNTETQHAAFHQQSPSTASRGSQRSKPTRHSSPDTSRPGATRHKAVHEPEGWRRHSDSRELNANQQQGGGGGGGDREGQGKGNRHGGEVSAAAMARQQAKALYKRRAEAVELYSGIVALAMRPRREDIADSCFTVLRRLKCWECVSVLRTTVGPMLDGTVNALLLPMQDFQQHMHQVSVAVADLSDLIMMPTPATTAYHPGNNSNNPQQQQQHSNRSKAGTRQADVSVLQLLLSFKVLELLAAVVDLSAIHASRLAQQQQAESQHHQPFTSQQVAPFHQEQYQLLSSVQVLTSSLTSSAAGWAYLAAASHGLAALAQAINPETQVSLDGGPLDIAAGLDPASGRPLLRQQLLLGTCGTAAAGGSSVTAELSTGLQRILLLSQAVAELQRQQQRAGNGRTQCTGSSSTAAAVQTLVQCCMSSVVGREAAVCALASSPAALKQLVCFLQSRDKVLKAAAGGETQDEAVNELAGLLDADDDPLSGDFGPSSSSSSSSAVPQPLTYESLYAPDLLLAVLSDPHPDVIHQWLPMADAVARAATEEVRVQDRHGAAAAAAAFPADSSAAVDSVKGSQGLKGLGLSAEACAGVAACQQQKSSLLQLQGYASAAQQLLMCWKCGDGSGSGSGACLVGQLQQLLPPLVSSTADSTAGTAAAGLATAGSGAQDSAQAAAAVAAASDCGPPTGAAAVAGAPPPWGKDVDPKAAAQLVRSPQDLAAALACLNLMAMLLQGPSTALRAAAAAAADHPTERAALKPALNPAAALNPNGALGSGGALDCWSGGVAVQDGLGSHVLVAELLDAGVLEVLDRALRAATCALEASTSDFLWGVRGGDCMDDLERLRGRSAAASLLLSAASAAAALMLLMAETDVADLSGCSLLDGVICAHIAAVTSQEGLAATQPTPQLISHLAAAAADPASSSAAAAAAAAAARRGGGRCHELLLQARQQLSVCLCCWQRCGWWPDCVGALLGTYPSASEALQQIAAEDAEARNKGDRSARPRPAPRQGPRQLLAALMALGDVCPPEWPPPGASQAVAAAADAAAAAGRPGPAVAFDRPSHMQLRSRIASSCESHMSALAELVSWGAAAESKLVRAALVRLCVRAGSLGGGMSPFLVPLLLEVLRDKLEAAIKAQQQLKAHLAKLAAAGQGAAAQQRALQAALPNAPQLSDGRRIIELLVPLASKPGFKAALLEHNVVGMLAKYLHKLATRSKDDPECHPVTGLVLQLLAGLCNPDVSLQPNAAREQREREDTPVLRDARDMVAAILASAHLLSADNAAAAASLLVGPCAAAGGRGLAQFTRGQAALRQGALRWFQSQSPDAPNFMQGNQFTAEALPAAIAWAAGRLIDAADQSPDSSHKASCNEIAAALRQLPTELPPEVEVDTASKTIMRFAKAVQEAVGAPSQSSAVSEDLASLLGQPAALLACDPTAAEFLALSSAGPQPSRQKRIRTYGDKLAAESASLSSLFGGDGLVPPKRPRTQSRPVQWLQAYVAQQGQGGLASAATAGRQQLSRDDSMANTDEVPEGVPNIPVVVAARRSAAAFKQGASSRKASMHVDDYQGQHPPFNPPAGEGWAPGAPPLAPAAAPGMPLAGLQAPMPGRPAVPPMPPAAPQSGGVPITGSGRIMRPGPPLPATAGAGGLPGAPGMRGGHLSSGMGGPHASAVDGMQRVPAVHVAVPHVRSGALPGPPLQQQQPRGPPPSDPRQQRRRRQQLQQQAPPLVTDLRRSESPTGGSDLLGGLAGDSPDYAGGNSPSYHSSPESVGGEVGQQRLSLNQEQNNDGGYRVTELE